MMEVRTIQQKGAEPAVEIKLPDAGEEQAVRLDLEEAIWLVDALQKAICHLEDVETSKV